MQKPNISADNTRLDMRKRLPELDGIRGCAIMLVLVWHYVQNQLYPEPGSRLAYFKQAIGFTWSGVDLFFVLSGFLIAGILIDQRRAPHYFRTFYVRRVCRIMPLYFLNLAIFLLVLSSSLAHKVVLAPLFGGDDVPLWSYFTFTQNIFMGITNSAGPGWLAVTWSLAVEEQFYLFLPFIIWYVPRARLPWVFLWIAAMAVYLRASAPGLSSYINTPWRADSLMIGALLAYLVRIPQFLDYARKYKALILAIFMTSATGLLFATLYGGLQLGGTYTHLSLALVYGIFILSALISQGGILSCFLRSRFLVWMGSISYGVYIIHTWISRLVHGLVRGDNPRMTTWFDAGTTLLALMVTLLVAYLSYKIIESKFIRFGHSVNYGKADK